jgi:hypothetical protein
MAKSATMEELASHAKSMIDALLGCPGVQCMALVWLLSSQSGNSLAHTAKAAVAAEGVACVPVWRHHML